MENRDREIIQELAKRYREIAEDPKNREREARIRRVNGLQAERPAVWIDEIPWNEMDIDGQLKLHCEDAYARGMEWFFRTTLFRWRYFQADMVVTPYYPVYKAYDETSIGLDVREQTIATDDTNHIISHHYEDELDSEEKLEALRDPVLTVYPDRDREAVARAQELLGDSLPVRLCGHCVYYAPWDIICRLRGAEPILIDCLERPEFTHAVIERFTRIYTARFTQMEKLGLLESAPAQLHCTPPFVDELPAPDYDGTHTRFQDVWFRGMAQVFSSVSSAMYYEYDIAYARGLMERCGLAYYGCCEPLDRVIPYLKRIPNLRKIGVSPWADVVSSAEQIGGDYVFARKPNPALVAVAVDEDVVRRETLETVRACKRFGCPYELVLKDISTVSRKPKNLIEWNRIVQQVLDEEYA